MVMVVEGLTYALFPSGVKKVMVQILSMDDSFLSNIGKALMIGGALLAWIVNI
jgi:uncharacterized protein YjeT (DUF2065 family)